jgi:hypothetical protein
MVMLLLLQSIPQLTRCYDAYSLSKLLDVTGLNICVFNPLPQEPLLISYRGCGVRVGAFVFPGVLARCRWPAGTQAAFLSSLFSLACFLRQFGAIQQGMRVHPKLAGAFAQGDPTGS